MIYLDSIQSPITLERILSSSTKHNTKDVLLLGETEWECHFGGKRVVDVIKSRGINIKVVHGSENNSYYEEFYNDLGLSVEDNAVFWPTLWLNWTEIQLVQTIDHYLYTPPKPKHHFICLNNRGHIQRCATVEELAKQGLIDRGVVTWIDHLRENLDYPFEYFDRTKERILSDDFINKLDSFILPEEFHDSFFHLLTEATIHVNFLTEKTAIPLLLKKPFAAVAAPGYHKFLQSLGFELYDELLDYSFDSEPDLHKRVEMLVTQMHEISNLDLNYAYSLIKKKAERNYLRALEIINDNNFIPNEIKQLVDEHGNDPKLRHHYKHFLDQTRPVGWFHVWNFSGSLKDTVDRALKQNSCEFIFDSANELESIFIFENKHEEHVDRLTAAGIPIRIILPAHETIHAVWLKEKTNNSIWRDADIIYWPLYWANRTFFKMSREWERNENISRGMDIFDNNVCLTKNHYDHLFVSLNNVPKTHRSLMMDMLAKHDLIDKGAIAWRDQPRDPIGEDGPPGNSILYPFKYWKNPRQMFLDQEDADQKNILFNQEALVKEFDSSFMQLVPETEDFSVFITEKTIVPLLFNKPFLVAGGAGHHAALKTLGFELYDEIFDYSFDDIEDAQERYEGIAKNVDSIKDKNLIELREIIRDKLVYNRKLLLSYIFDNVPADIKKLDTILTSKKSDLLYFQLYVNLRHLKHEIY